MEQSIPQQLQAADCPEHPQLSFLGVSGAAVAVLGAIQGVSTIPKAWGALSPCTQQSPCFSSPARAAPWISAVVPCRGQGQCPAADTCPGTRQPRTVHQSRSLANFRLCLQGCFCSCEAPGQAFHPYFLCLRPRPP